VAAIAAERIVVHRRSQRRTIHDVVFDARQRIRRTTPSTLAHELAGTDPPTVIDTRTPTDRERYGVIEGSIHVPRTVVEWHLDPANGYRHPAVTRFDQPLVVVCNGGYSSALAVVSLLDLGFTTVSDLVGGMRAWISAGYPVARPDHCHLDL
jgi:rhodanese-related sulfurtransferase